MVQAAALAGRCLNNDGHSALGRLEEQPVRRPFIMPEACQFRSQIERNVENIVSVIFLVLL